MFEYCMEPLCYNEQPCSLHQTVRDFSTAVKQVSKESNNHQSSVLNKILRFPKGTAINQDSGDSKSARLSVMSYNILAPAYVRPMDTRTGEVQDFAGFPWASDADLDWNTRQQLIAQEITKASADVICLQEVQFVRKASSDAAEIEYELPPFLRLKGYETVIPPQAELQIMAERNLRVLRAVDSPVGNALLVCAKRLSIVAQDTSTRCLSVCVRGKGALSSLLPVAVSCLHLDASSEEKRAQQVRVCCERIKSRFRVRDIVLAGDFNTECEPGSVLSRFCHGEAAPTREQLIEQWKTDARQTREPTNEEEKKWNLLHEEALVAAEALRLFLVRAPLGPTRAGFDHNSNAPPCVSWKLDHIWVSSRHLTLHSVWETLEADEASTRLGLPNKMCPSDHLPVLATFDVNNNALLDDEFKASFLVRLEAHRSSCQAVQAQIEATKSDTDSKSKAPADQERAKPAKKAKPSPEEIAALQASRAKKKELITSLESERAVFWKSLSEMERDAVEDLGFDKMTV